MADPKPTERRPNPPASRTPAASKVPTSLTHPLPSGEFPLETQFDVLRRFMGASRNGTEPVEPAAAEGRGVPLHAAQLNAAFLCDIGLLIEEMPGRFKPTPVAMQLINTQIADDRRGRRLLRSVIEKTWFGLTARIFLRTESAGSFREQDLAAALGAAAHVPSGQDEAALRILLDYLAYTGILVRPDRSPPKETGTATQVASIPSGLPPSAPVPPSTMPAEAPPGPGTDPSDEDGGWELIRTSEFSLKILPKAAAVKRLRKQLDLLEQKLREGAKPGSDR